MNAGARISLRNDSNLCGGERGQASQRTGMVGLLLATKQKRGSHIVPSNSFTRSGKTPTASVRGIYLQLAVNMAAVRSCR